MSARMRSIDLKLSFIDVQPNREAQKPPVLHNLNG